MRFGPHTVTHPILERCSADRSAREIRDSWHRLSSEASDPQPIFSYPNGQPGDFGDREFAVVRELGLLGGVSGSVGYASSKHWQERPNYRFHLPRFPFSDEEEACSQVITGFERVKQVLRGEQA